MRYHSPGSFGCRRRRSSSSGQKAVLRYSGAFALLISVLLIACSGRSARAEEEAGRCARSGPVSLCTAQEFPVQGSPCEVRLMNGEEPVEGAEIRVTYRPNSEVAVTRPLGVTDAAGRISWRPEESGIVTLHAEKAGGAASGESGGDGDESGAPEQMSGGIAPVDLTVSVRFRSAPWLGIAIMILAALILFGGNGYSFAKTFSRS